jgi:hypothetical protein
MDGLGIPKGQDIREISFLSSALQSRQLHEEIMGEWEAPMQPAGPSCGARSTFPSLVGVLDERLLVLPDFYRKGLQGKRGLAHAKTRAGVPSSPLRA